MVIKIISVVIVLIANLCFWYAVGHDYGVKNTPPIKPEAYKEGYKCSDSLNAEE
jgi:hypothetical protein